MSYKRWSIFSFYIEIFTFFGSSKAVECLSSLSMPLSSITLLLSIFLNELWKKKLRIFHQLLEFCHLLINTNIWRNLIVTSDKIAPASNWNFMPIIDFSNLQHCHIERFKKLSQEIVVSCYKFIHYNIVRRNNILRKHECFYYQGTILLRISQIF